MLELLRAWDIGPPVDVRAVEEGTNNTSYFVGDQFVLRIHRNRGFLEYEHAVLRALRGLSFEVPVPLETVEGTTLAHGELDGREVLASMARRIPGEHPQRGNVVQAAVCGSALAELDRALARLDPATLPARAEWDGDLERVHPRVPSLPEFVAQLPADRRQRVGRILDRVSAGAGLGEPATIGMELPASTPAATSLPRQIVHGDFGVTNTLMTGERVTGVLDLEFTGPGYRAMDLATGMAAFGRDEWSGPKPWPVTEAFQRGYLSGLPLGETEVAVLPDLHLLREATSLVHWFGRYLDGLTSAQDISTRIDRLLWLDELLHP